MVYKSSKIPLFQVTPLDWVFWHWSPRNVTSHHNDCLNKRAVGDRAVRKKPLMSTTSAPALAKNTLLTNGNDVTQNTKHTNANDVTQNREQQKYYRS